MLGFESCSAENVSLLFSTKLGIFHHLHLSHWCDSCIFDINNTVSIIPYYIIYFYIMTLDNELRQRFETCCDKYIPENIVLL